MTHSVARRIVAGIAGLCLLGFAAAAPAAPVDKKEVLRQAHSAYYSLKSRGLADFQCNAAPNWEAVLQEQRKTDPQGADRGLALLNQIRFTVFVQTSGTTKVTHNTVTAQNSEMAKGFDQIYTGMEQAMTGFFDTWSPFMITTPFPEADSEYVLADEGDHWTLSYKEGATTDVATTMGKDLVIREMKVNTPQFSSSIRPKFTRSPQGFLLTGYNADYRGQTPAETTHLDVDIAYQIVNGFQVPQKLNMSGTYGGDAFQMEIAFSGCLVKGQ
jgi:hypothetical protein